MSRSSSLLLLLALSTWAHLIGAWTSDLAMMTASQAANAAQPKMREGSPCVYRRDGVPMEPFCPGGKYTCVATSIPNPEVMVYNGYCDSNYQKRNHCLFKKIPFAVGVKDITFNPLCHKCDCKLYPSIPNRNKAACMCDALPPCYVNYNGQPVGNPCPSNQKMCVITRPGTGSDRFGLPIDMGQCVFSGISGVCASGGSNWGPKFFMQGVRGVPKGGNRCTSCTCGAKGKLLNCVTKRGCRRP